MTNKELSKRAGKVLQPEKNKHLVLNQRGTRGSCSKCDKSLDWTDWGNKCEFPDPVPIDWPNAGKWRDWCVEKYGEKEYVNNLWFVYKDVTGEAVTFKSWLAVYIQPKHYIEAVIRCVENENS